MDPSRRTPAPEADALLPHPPLTDYYRDEAEHARYLRRIFDATAADYDRIERVLALGSGPWYRRTALQRAGLARGRRCARRRHRHRAGRARGAAS